MNSDFGIQKTNAGIRINFQKIPCVPILRQNGQLWPFWPIFAQKWILELEFQKTDVEIRISILEIPCVSISEKTDNFDFLSPNLPKNWFWGWNFKNLSLYSKSAPPTYLESQCSVKMDKFEFSGQNLRKLPNYMSYFGWGCCRGLRGGWNDLGAGRSSWVEVHGGGCTV